MPSQKPIHVCECGRSCHVVQLTAYEFQWRCLCGHNQIISFAHKDPPPTFQTASQPELFSKESLAGIQTALECAHESGIHEALMPIVRAFEERS